MGSGNDTAYSANTTLTMSSTPHLLFAPFRVESKPLVRRMAYWWFLAGLLPLLLMILLSYLAINPWSLVSRIAVLSLILWGMALFYATYHQQVDSHGIWELAFLFRRGWAWSRFTSEHIYRAGNTFFDAKAKWWQVERCSLDRFTEQQRTAVLEHINTLWHPPALAEQLQLNTFRGWHRSLEIRRKFKFDNQWLRVTFSADGVVLDGSAKNDAVELLPWSEVRSIDVIRGMRDKSVPSKLMVRFRNAREPLPFYLHEIDNRTLCQIETCLLKWSLPGTVEQLAFRGLIKSVREALIRKLHYRKQLKSGRNLLRVNCLIVPPCITYLIWHYLQERPMNHIWDVALLLGAISPIAISIGALFIATNCKMQKERQSLEEAEAFLRQADTNS